MANSETILAGSTSATNVTLRNDDTGSLTVLKDAAQIFKVDASGNVTQGVSGGSGSILLDSNGSSTGGFIYEDQTQMIISQVTSGPIIFRTANSEKMRVDASGNLGVGASSTSVANGGFLVYQNTPTATTTFIGHASGVAGGSQYSAFRYNNVDIGSITQNSTTGVLFNTTSDYRLKTVIAQVSGSGDRIDALQPVEYEWKSDGSRTRGFLAHQFQEVYAGSVSGIKDAVDADGNPIYQSMQAGSSEVIADLVAEIQSLRARLLALETK